MKLPGPFDACVVSSRVLNRRRDKLSAGDLGGMPGCWIQLVGDRDRIRLMM